MKRKIATAVLCVVMAVVAKMQVGVKTAQAADQFFCYSGWQVEQTIVNETEDYTEHMEYSSCLDTGAYQACSTVVFHNGTVQSECYISGYYL